MPWARACSKHLDGAAFDIAMKPRSGGLRGCGAEVGFLGFGFYPRSGFIHVDLRPARQWGERFPVRATAFAMRRRPRARCWRQPHHEGRRGSQCGDAGRSPGVEVAQQVLAETDPRSCRLCRISTRCVGYSSPWRLAASRSRSTRVSMTGAEGSGDGPAPIGFAASPWMRAALDAAPSSSPCSCSCFRASAVRRASGTPR